MPAHQETTITAGAARDFHSRPNPGTHDGKRRRKRRPDSKASAGKVLGGMLLAAMAFTSALQAQDPPFRSYGGSSVSFDARVHAQYEAPSPEGAVSTFSMRRAWITLDGRYNDFVSCAEARCWTRGSR